MAIYISGVKNLPEQVQKNKDDIEDLQTADTNLDAKIDLEIADRKALIEASGNNTIIKNPTENVIVSLNETETNRIFSVSIDGTPKFSFDETSILANENTAVNGDLVVSGNIDGGSATISGNITTMGDISGNNATISTDITAGGDLDIDGNITAGGDIVGDSVSTTNDIKSGGNVEVGNKVSFISDGVLETDGLSFEFKALDSSDNQHILKFDADTQKLTIDGNEVGGKQLYRHNIFIDGATTTPARTYRVYFNIINDDPTPLNSMASLYNYMTNKNLDSYNKSIIANGLFRESSTNYHIVSAYKGGSLNSLAVAYINESSGNITSFEYMTQTTLVNDTIETI